MVLVRLRPSIRRRPSRPPLTRRTGPQDLVLLQLEDCPLYITAIELLRAKSNFKNTLNQAACLHLFYFSIYHQLHPRVPSASDIWPSHSRDSTRTLSRTVHLDLEQLA